MFMENGGGMYEGNDPYLFISYSHRDYNCLNEIKVLLETHHIRFWYDNGLHSGDDWNLVIAKRLKDAAACLLLLSPESAESEYVKNELNFALSRRIPIHTLLLDRFPIPIDIEMMLGRLQMIERVDGYENRLLKSIPPELYTTSSCKEEKEGEHPLYQVTEELMNRQGTVTCLGRHKKLEYQVLIQKETVKLSDKNEALEQVKMISGLSHPLFPQIYDVVFEKDRIWTYQEYRGEQFLDQYLEKHELTEDKIMEWILSIIDGMEYLFRLNLGFRDLPHGSMVVLNGNRIGMFRLQNLYYGVLKLQPDTRQYYFEKEVEEIAVLLYQICTGEIPIRPFRIIDDNRFSSRFLNKVNLVVQKCAKEQGRTGYIDFQEIKDDIVCNRLKMRDLKFLNQRRKKLCQYEQEKERCLQKFTDDDCQAEIKIRRNSLEKEYGLEDTVLLGDVMENLADSGCAIRIIICSTGQLFEFAKDAVVIGRTADCDLALNQPSISRRHIRISKDVSGTYYIEDLNTKNGTYLITDNTETMRIPVGEKVKISANSMFSAGCIRFKLL